MLKKLLIGTAALAVVATPLAASARPYGHGGHWGGGGAVAAGLFGLALGAAIADSHPAYAYDYAPPYAVRCHWETRAYPGPWGSVNYQQVRVCY